MAITSHTFNVVFSHLSSSAHFNINKELVMDCYMGTILPFAFNFAPSYFDFCNGQQYRVSQYQALFALLGKFYGGDGATTFNLPNLQGRMPIGFGQLQTVIHNMGDTGGTANVQLSTANMPAHTHTPALQVKLQASGTANPTTPASIPQHRRRSLVLPAAAWGWQPSGQPH
jgi:microcystin-dependent protein